MKIREQALKSLNDFSENFLRNYAKDRNFDNGAAQNGYPLSLLIIFGAAYYIYKKFKKSGWL